MHILIWGVFTWKNVFSKVVQQPLPLLLLRIGINFIEFGKLINFQIEQGINALVVCGTTGEAATMSEEEKKEVMKFSISCANGRVPIILGTGSNNTKTAIENAIYAEKIGADSILVVTPYYNKTTQKGLIAHFTAIANSTNLPIILYNVPSRTGVNILPETCLELSKIDNIVAIKEASGNISQVAQIANLCGDNLAIYSGNDDQTIPIMSLGGLGVISVLSNIIPKECVTLTNEFFNGNLKTARDLELKYLDLANLLFCEVNPIPIKAALNMIGYNFGIPRLPLIDMSNQNKEKLANLLKKHELINIY